MPGLPQRPGDDGSDSGMTSARIKPSSGNRIGGPLDGIDTPTLRGLWATAPYLHDGSAATLRDVLTTANPAARHGNLSTLTSAQIDQLVEYLNQLEAAP